MKSNIILIVTDQHALHAISCYDGNICRTPNIDKLAQDGIQFMKAYTPCALCTPARASLLSGVYPHQHGAMQNTGTLIPFNEDETRRDIELYPQKLKEAGYQIGYMGKWHAGLAKTCNDVGFEGYGPEDYGWQYKDSKEYKEYLNEKNLLPPREVIEFSAEGPSCTSINNTSGYVKGDTEATASHFIANKSIDLINKFKKKDKPFFMTCNFWGPHAPYWPSEEYKDMYDYRMIKPWNSFSDELNNKPLIHKKYRECIMPAAAKADWETWAKMIARYYAQTSMIDAAIGKIIDGLKKAETYNETTIIFTSDHGESIGIHGGTFDKGAMAYEEMYHIPMIIKMPNQEGKGTKRQELVSLLDLTPTICEIAGTKMKRQDGQSLISLIKNQNNEWREDLISEFHGHRFPVSQRIIWWKRYKYILNFADIDELYDLERDQSELNNLITDEEYKSIIDEMQRRLLRNMQNSNDHLGPESSYILTRPYKYSSMNYRR